jgi:hypothetical protein
LSSAGATAAAAPVESAKHDAADVSLQDSLRMFQGLLEAGAFFEFGFVDGGSAQQEVSGSAASCAGCVDFEREPGGSSDGQSG